MSKEKDAGTTFEREVAYYLRGRGFRTRRQALAGRYDRGDLELSRPTGHMPVQSLDRWAVECKFRRDAKSSLNLGGWVDESQRERRNYATAWSGEDGIDLASAMDHSHPLLIVKRVRKGAAGAFVIQSLEDWCDEKGAYPYRADPQLSGD